MDTVRFQRLATLFDDVRDLPADRRRAALDQACGDDAALRREVEALLERHDAARTDDREELLDAASALRGALIPPEADDARPDDPLPGHVGRYRILGEIARGGFGVVLRGEDVTIGRDVAVKILPPTHAGDRRLADLLHDEGRISGRLQHPGIVPVYELGRFDDERPFVAMKVVEGQTLASLLRERASPDTDRPRFVAIFEQIGQTIAYAHARGVLHRDLKPQNVMVGAFGEVQVMDWGLAVALEPRHDGTRPDGSVGLGTPAYMAPEQARSEPAALDPRSDVFGLGAILCEILTGAPPFAGEDGRATLERARAGDVGDAHARVRACGADAELIDLALRCTAAAPGDRPADAREVAQAVRAYLDSREQRTREAELEAATARARARSERKARRLSTALGAVVALVSVVGAGLWLWLEDAARDRQRQATSRLQSALLDAERATADASAERPETSIRWRAAASTAANAARLVGPDVDPQLASRALALSTRSQSRLRDVLFAERIQAIALEDRFLSTYDRSGQVAAYGSAFEEYVGLPVVETAPEAFAAALADHPFLEELIATLDVWSFSAEQVDRRSPVADWVQAVASLLDTGGWRADARDAIIRRDVARMLELAKRDDARDAPPSATVHLAIRLMMAREEHASLDLLHQTAERYGGDFEAVFNLAMIHLSHGEDWQALRFATAACALRPDSALPHTVLTSALMAVGKPREAVASARRTIELSHDDYGPNVLVGAVLLETGHLDEVDELVHDYRERAPHNHAIYAELASLCGNLRMAQGDFDAAVDAFVDAVTCPQAWPKDPTWRLGEPGAIDGLRRAIEVRLAAAPQPDPALRYLHARLIEDLGELRAALRTYEALERQRPGFLHCARRILEIRASLGGPLASIDAVDRAVTRLDPALTPDDAERALRADGGSIGRIAPAVAAFLDGRLLARAGRHEAAAEALRRALEVDREEPLVWLRLHEALAAVGGRARADAEIRELLAAGPMPRLPMPIPPAIPRPVSPEDGATPTGEVVLRVDGFAAADPRHRHTGTVFVVHAVGDDPVRSPRIAVIDESGGTLTIPDGLLVPGVAYAWRARFQVEPPMIESDWSDARVFRAPPDGARPVPIDLAAHFDVDVIANPGDPDDDPFDPPNDFRLVVDGFDGAATDVEDVQGVPVDRRVGVHVLGSYDGANAVQIRPDRRAELRVPVPRGRYRALLLLDACGNGAARTSLQIVYADATVGRYATVVPDWFADGFPENLGSESLPQPVLGGMDRMAPTGVEQRDAAILHESYVPCDPTREVVELRILCGETRFESTDTAINLLAITGMQLAGADGR